MKRPVVLIVGAAAGALLIAAVGASAHSGLFLTPVGVHQGFSGDEASGARTESPEPTESPEASPTAEPTELPEPSPTAEPTEKPEPTKAPEPPDEDGGSKQAPTSGSGDHEGDGRFGGGDHSGWGHGG